MIGVEERARQMHDVRMRTIVSANYVSVCVTANGSGDKIFVNVV